jgi:anti-sigma factor RsiW
MIHPLSEEFSGYLDGELPAERAAMLERHVAQCAECARLLDELRRVVARAQGLDDRPPRHDLWPGVAAAIGAGADRTRRITLPLPVLLAAGLALMLGSAGGALLWQRSRATGRLAVGDSAAAATAVVPAATASERGFAGAVRALEQELRTGPGRLDTLTVRVLAEKLALIDRAITEAERALATDPANSYLAGHLTQTRMRKLELLRRAAFLHRAVS